MECNSDEIGRENLYKNLVSKNCLIHFLWFYMFLLILINLSHVHLNRLSKPKKWLGNIEKKGYIDRQPYTKILYNTTFSVTSHLYVIDRLYTCVFVCVCVRTSTTKSGPLHENTPINSGHFKKSGPNSRSPHFLQLISSPKWSIDGAIHYKSLLLKSRK